MIHPKFVHFVGFYFPSLSTFYYYHTRAFSACALNDTLQDRRELHVRDAKGVGQSLLRCVDKQIASLTHPQRRIWISLSAIGRNPRLRSDSIPVVGLVHRRTPSQGVKQGAFSLVITTQRRQENTSHSRAPNTQDKRADQLSPDGQKIGKNSRSPEGDPEKSLEDFLCIFVRYIGYYHLRGSY